MAASAGPFSAAGLNQRFLTDATGVVEVLHGLDVGLQLIALIPDIDPLIFHYLL